MMLVSCFIIVKFFLATPFGQVPVLECDGQIICQSIAIARYVAKENGLAGKDNWTQAQADMVVDCLMDLFYRGQ